MTYRKTLLASIALLLELFLANCSNDSNSSDSSTNGSSSSLNTPSDSQSSSSSNLEPSSSSDSEPSSSSSDEPPPPPTMSKYITEPYIENNKIKYSYSYGGYDFYYIYLGKLKSVPLYSYRTQHHNGIGSAYTVEVTETLKNSTEETITNSSQTTINIVDEHTTSTTSELKLSQTINVKFPIKIVNMEVKLAAEENWKQYISNTTTLQQIQTTSLTNTVTFGTEHTKTVMESRTWNFTRDDRIGYYRYTLFSASDVYLYVIKDSMGVIHHEFIEHIIPNSSDDVWALDYSEDGNFGKNDSTGFKLDVSMLDNLPKTDTSFTALPTHTERIKSIEFTTAGNHAYTFDESFPATIDVWVLGGGGGGQGGHRWQCGLWACDGTGGGGGGGAAAYANFEVMEPVTFSTTVGAGGYAGAAGTTKSGGGHGGSGGLSSVTASGGIAFILTAGGGGGGGTTSSGCTDSNGDNPLNYGCGAGGIASQSGISATLKNGSHGTLGSESDNMPVGGGGGNGGNAEGYSGGTGGIGGYGNSSTGGKLRLSGEGSTGKVRIVIKYLE